MEMNKMVKITKDMTIGKVLEEHPEDAMKLSEVMSSFGLHCVGCGAAMFETLEQGVKVHGMDDAKVDELVEKLNGVLSKCCKIESKNKGIKLTPAAVNKVKDIMKDAARHEKNMYKPKPQNTGFRFPGGTKLPGVLGIPFLLQDFMHLYNLQTAPEILPSGAPKEI